MLDKSHIDIAGQQRELDRSQFVESPALAAASGGNRFVPNCSDFFAQRFVFDLPKAGKSSAICSDAVVCSVGLLSWWLP